MLSQIIKRAFAAFEWADSCVGRKQKTCPYVAPDCNCSSDVKYLKADGKLHRQSLLFHVFSKISVHTFHLTGLTPFKLVHKPGSSPA